MKRYALTENQFQGLADYKDWGIREIPFEDIHNLPHIPRRQDVVAIFASGDMNATKVLNGIEAVFGMDVIAHECRPNVAKCEPPLNIYHCVIQKLANPRGEIAYVMYGPSESETLFGHWQDYTVLDDYIKLTEWKD